METFQLGLELFSGLDQQLIAEECSAEAETFAVVDQMGGEIEAGLIPQGGECTGYITGGRTLAL
ncbi:hypothetical protein SDC9_85279 [bioreactor metagenome]|uniref:Uncharacterized protein n=1 Tax=bioreactor metagenome TaxID=1076179 RepID=A0A644ZD26_9ZZZZ